MENYRDEGLKMKYQIQKTNGKQLDEGFRALVMRYDGGKDPVHLAACRKAISVYAEAIKDHIPLMAEDIKKELLKYTENVKIEVGQIWEVADENFFATKDLRELGVKNDDRTARFYLRKGSKIEIRYPYEWHYRTEDNHYYNSKPEYILGKCKLYGVIDDDVKSKNKARLEEILRIGLYTKTSE